MMLLPARCRDSTATAEWSVSMSDELYPAARLGNAAVAAGLAGLDALWLTPGPDLRYVVGYDAHALERLTCLVIPSRADPFLVVPRPAPRAAQASPAGSLGIGLIAWDETDGPYALVASRLGRAGGSGAVGLADRMWALMVLRFRAALPQARQERASLALGPLRARKSPAEIAALREAAPAIDRVHEQVPGGLRAGRTEDQVAADIGDAILAAGHCQVDFTIVASGPNAASPHHTASDRVLRAGDVVVVDIGGAMPRGSCPHRHTAELGSGPADRAS